MDFGHLKRLLPEEQHVYQRLEAALHGLGDCMRRESFFGPSYEIHSVELADCLKEAAGALTLAGSQQTPWQWETATGPEGDARQLLTMGEGATPEWVRQVLNRLCAHEEARWRNVRQHVMAFAEAVLKAIRPVDRPPSHAPSLRLAGDGERERVVSLFAASPASARRSPGCSLTAGPWTAVVATRTGPACWPSCTTRSPGRGC